MQEETRKMGPPGALVYSGGFPGAGVVEWRVVIPLYDGDIDMAAAMVVVPNIWAGAMRLAS